MGHFKTGEVQVAGPPVYMCLSLQAMEKREEFPSDATLNSTVQCEAP